MTGTKWTPEEVARALANRPNHPHYIAAMVRKAIKHETAALLAEHEALMKRIADAPHGMVEQVWRRRVSHAFVIDVKGGDLEMSGQNVRIVPEPREVGNG